MIYIIVGQALNGDWLWITGNNNLEQIVMSYRSGWTGYQKIKLLLINVQSETVTTLMEK